MTRHRSYSIEFKRQVAQEFLAGEAGRIQENVAAIKTAEREGRFSDAETLLLAEIELIERDSARTPGWGVAPAYYLDLVIVYRKQNRFLDEEKVLQRYEWQTKSPEEMPNKSAARLDKVRKRNRKLGIDA